MIFSHQPRETYHYNLTNFKKVFMCLYFWRSSVSSLHPLFYPVNSFPHLPATDLSSSLCDTRQYYYYFCHWILSRIHLNLQYEKTRLRQGNANAKWNQSLVRARDVFIFRKTACVRILEIENNLSALPCIELWPLCSYISLQHLILDKKKFHLNCWNCLTIQARSAWIIYQHPSLTLC